MVVLVFDLFAVMVIAFIATQIAAPLFGKPFFWFFRKEERGYLKAVAAYTGNWVPSTVMGTGGSSVNGATALVELLTAKTARDLNLDLTIPKH